MGDEGGVYARSRTDTGGYGEAAGALGEIPGYTAGVADHGRGPGERPGGGYVLY